MTNEEANDPIGLASRKIGFALVEQIAGQDWRDRDVDEIQEAFSDFGHAIAQAIIKNGSVQYENVN